MKVTLCQINPIVGALEENAQKIIDLIANHSDKSDLIVFPEMVLTGYPPEDLLFDNNFIKEVADQLNNIISIVKSTPVIVGTIRESNGKLYNSAIVIQNSSIIGVSDKTHLPTYDVFDEKRYFYSSNSINPIEIKIKDRSIMLGVLVCEDLWDKDYDLKVCDVLCEKGAELLINISASPFHVGKLKERVDIIKMKSKRLDCPFIYCNLIGAQDELVFDGSSCVLNANGDILKMLSRFEECIDIVNLNETKIVDFIEVSEENQIFEALSLGIRDYFYKSGHVKAVIGLSGGIDSALTAVIAQNALGFENVLGVAMPSVFSSDHSVNDARELAENLEIEFEIISIEKINNEMLYGLSKIFNGSKSGLAEENLQARIRGNILMTIANKRGALLLNTGNKTETALGYCTMYGDMAGALAVISDLNKTQVYNVSNWINNHFEKTIIPNGTITKPPSAELSPNQVDPFDYDIVSPLIDSIITDKNNNSKILNECKDNDMIKDLLKRVRLSEFKRRQSAPGIRVSKKAFGMGRKYPIINKFEG